MSSLSRGLVIGALALAAALAASNAPAAPAPGLMLPPDVASSPAWKYANLDATGCEAELSKRGVPFAKATAAGVAAPVRLTGPIRGVTFHSQLPAAQRATSPYEILDCRLVLALDDFAVVLGKYDVNEVVHYSVYRPPIKSWPADKIGKQHTGALAIDAAHFVRKDGSVLQVERDFHGAIGAQTCGGSSGPWPATSEAIALRGILCEAATAHLFNVVLTPDYNWAHRNHFHLEVTAGAKWFLVK